MEIDGGRGLETNQDHKRIVSLRKQEGFYIFLSAEEGEEDG